MKGDKDRRVRRRLRFLRAAALVLGLLLLVTGYAGFLSAPAEPPLPAETIPSTEATIPTETTIPTEATIPTENTICVEDTIPAENPFPAEDTIPTVETLPPESILPTVETLPSETVTYMAEGFPVPVPGEADREMPCSLIARIAFGVLLVLEVLVLSVLVVLGRNVRKHNRKGRLNKGGYPTTLVSPASPEEETQAPQPIPGISLGKLHAIGRRDYQQDSFGHTPLPENAGVLAVLADGMGGLSGGERVSQKIVMEALNYGAAITPAQLPNALPEMVDRVNTAVNEMLGPQGLYASGSTVVATLVAQNSLRWISVGDSRVYLYRQGQLNQLSRDHDLLQEWMTQILEGKRSLAESLADPEGRKLTSFVGMGQLLYVDGCHTPIPLLPGDRVLLMSDGVYGTVSDGEMEAILAQTSNVQQAATRIGQRIEAVASPYQDNYTLVILGFDIPG